MAFIIKPGESLQPFINKQEQTAVQEKVAQVENNKSNVSNLILNMLPGSSLTNPDADNQSETKLVQIIIAVIMFLSLFCFIFYVS